LATILAFKKKRKGESTSVGLAFTLSDTTSGHCLRVLNDCPMPRQIHALFAWHFMPVKQEMETGHGMDADSRTRPANLHRDPEHDAARPLEASQVSVRGWESEATPNSPAPDFVRSSRLANDG
jgi:hypothetical protein